MDPFNNPMWQRVPWATDLAKRFVAAGVPVAAICGGTLGPIPFTREALAELDIYEPALLNTWYLLFNEHDPSGLAGLPAGAPA